MNWLWIGLGGALGAILRYSISLLFQSYKKENLATFVVNIIGSFLFGLLMNSSLEGSIPSFYLFITAGFLGAFTTFSTFTHQTISLFTSKMPLKAFAYISFHLLIIMLMTFIGFNF